MFYFNIKFYLIFQVKSSKFKNFECKKFFDIKINNIFSLDNLKKKEIII